MKNFSTVLVVIQCILYVNLEATNKIDTKILGGSPGTLTEIYYQVSLQYRFNITSNYTHYCGGIIVNLKNVLTAAQCVFDASTNNIVQTNNIRVVSETLSPSVNNSGQTKNILKIVVHPNYKYGQSFDSDIAILKLASPFEQTLTLKAIEMNLDAVPDSTFCVISGYGQSLNLSRADVPIINLESCKRLFPSGGVKNNMMCAGSLGANVCTGDFGGPLVCNGKVAGIASFTAIGCNTALPAVYTNVSKFTSWVIENSATSANLSVFVVAFVALFRHLLM